MTSKSKTQKPITVIVSVFNRLDYLRKALLSIQAQSVLPAEVVVTDDGSSEPVVDFLRELAPRFDFKLKLALQQDLGFRVARCKNNGVRIAQNEFLIFWDQDVVGARDYIKTYWDFRKQRHFLVSYPVRLDEQQTNYLTEEDIQACRFDHLLRPEQMAKIKKQYRKDRFYYFLRKFILKNDTRPKLRGGFFSVCKTDLIRVNGFDENYQGWGNEDDDLGRRLYASGVVGLNPFYDQFPIHLYHPPHHQNGERVNQQYYLQRQREIKEGKFKAEYGLDHTLGDDPVQIMEF
ncbi:MAG: glycosyltransferase [Caldisericaceae bacterium]|nr:glycosyltransferase [Caldisericaceae bacterium]